MALGFQGGAFGLGSAIVGSPGLAASYYALLVVTGAAAGALLVSERPWRMAARLLAPGAA